MTNTDDTNTDCGDSNMAPPPAAPAAPPHRHQRHQKVFALGKSTCRRIARRGGVKSMTSKVPAELTSALRTYVQDILRNVVAIVEGGKRKTVTHTDVDHALSLRGACVYGI